MTLKLNSKSYIFLIKGDDLFLVFEKSFEYSLNLQNKSELNFFIYDTFDGRLLSKNILLFGNDRHFYILSPNGKKYDYFDFEHASIPFKVSDIDNDKIKKILSVASIRAIMPIISLNGKMNIYNLKNMDKKTIAKCSMWEFFHKDDNFAFLVVKPLKGFTKEVGEFVSLIKSFGLNHSRGDIVKSLLNKFPDITPTYSNKVHSLTKPDEAADKSVASIILELLYKVDANIDGIINDYDTEFLHDYRVALRKSRSILSETKGVFDKEKTKYFNGLFRYFAKITNRLRDIDVYLVKLEEFKRDLPEDLKKGINQIEEYLLKIRKEEHKKVTDFLKSQEFKKDFLSAVNFFENEYANSSGSLAKKKVFTVAGRSINNCLDNMLNNFEKSEYLPPETLHKFRINFKKIRYLIEAFGKILYEEKLENRLKKLKEIQEEIGLYHDYHNHIIILKNLLEEISEHDEVMERGVKHLEKIFSKRSDKLRTQVIERLNDFLKNKNIMKYKVGV